MTKKQIVELFTKKGILSGRSGLVRRPFCWEKKFDAEARHVFNEFRKGYRTEEEAWFCLCRDIELPICPVCKKEKVKFTGITKNGGTGYNTTCEHCSANAVPSKIQKFKGSIEDRTEEQRKCIVARRRATNIKRYGEPNHLCYGSESFANLMQRRYGTRTFNNRAKTRATCLSRYGVPSNLLREGERAKARTNAWTPECRAKRIANCQKKNGTIYITQLPEVQEKMTRAKRKHIRELEMRYDCRLLADVTREFGQGYKHIDLEYLRFGMYVFVQNKDIPAIVAYAREGTHTNKYTSKPEKEVVEFVRSVYKGDIIENCTSIVPNGNHRFFELDVYIPELRLGIDFNGVYWHSTKFKDELYHQRKTWCCRKAGVSLIHIFEDEWNKNRRFCKTIIEKCINRQFQNEIHNESGIIVGNNAYPIPEQATILEITKPQRHQVGRVSYFDCGTILYKMEGEKQ